MPTTYNLVVSICNFNLVFTSKLVTACKRLFRDWSTDVKIWKVEEHHLWKLTYLAGLLPVPGIFSCCCHDEPVRQCLYGGGGVRSLKEMRNFTRLSLSWNISLMLMESPKYRWRSAAQSGQKRSKCHLPSSTVRTDWRRNLSNEGLVRSYGR